MVIFYLKNNSKKTLRKIWNVIEKGSIFAALSQNGEATRPPLEREEKFIEEIEEASVVQ